MDPFVFDDLGSPTAETSRRRRQASVDEDVSSPTADISRRRRQETLFPSISNVHVKVPMFDPLNYPLWKSNMETYLRSCSHRIWVEVSKGSMIPIDIDDPSPEEEFQLAINSKALAILNSSLSTNERAQIQGVQSAHEAWTKLEMIHEGTSQVRKAKRRQLIKQFYNFTVPKGEKIEESIQRFTKLVNLLKAVGKKIEQEDLNHCFLNSLGREWNAKVTAIEESKDLETITLDELYGNLITYEIHLDAQEKNDPIRQSSKALVVESEDSDDEVGLLVKRFRRIARKNGDEARRFVKERYPKDKVKDQENKCYKCGKLGHFMKDCRVKEPQLKDKKAIYQRKKALQAEVAHWESFLSGSESDNGDRDDLALTGVVEDDLDKEFFALMAIDDDKEVCNISSHYKIIDERDDLIQENDLLDLKYQRVKKEFRACINEYNDTLENHIALQLEHDIFLTMHVIALEEKHDLMKSCAQALEDKKNDSRVGAKEIENKDASRPSMKVKPSVMYASKKGNKKDHAQVIKESKTSLKKQRHMPKQKAYAPKVSQPLVHVVKQKPSSIPKKVVPKKETRHVPMHKHSHKHAPTHKHTPTCFYCNRKGHVERVCRAKNNKNLVWVPKGEMKVTNLQGPKTKRVPTSYGSFVGPSTQWRKRRQEGQMGRGQWVFQPYDGRQTSLP